MKTLTTAKLHTPDLRLALVSWRSELLSLANGKAELLRGDAWEEQAHVEA
jgi:hypothetical protein